MYEVRRFSSVLATAPPLTVLLAHWRSLRGLSRITFPPPSVVGVRPGFRVRGKPLLPAASALSCLAALDARPLTPFTDRASTLRALD